MIELFSDEFFMREALKEARYAFEEGEVPVGCVIVSQQQIIARAHNTVEQLGDVTAHAEIQAITAAENYLGSKYLMDCTMYVTVEPCIMCASALALAQIGSVVYGTGDNKRGFTQFSPMVLNKKIQVIPGILDTECAELVKDFFKVIRK